MNDRVNDALALFFRMEDSSGYFSSLDRVLTGLSPAILPVGKAFRQNLWGTVSTLEMPSTLAFAGAREERLNRLYLSEVFRAKRDLVGTEYDHGDLPEAYRQRAVKESQLSLDRELHTDEGLRALVGAMLHLLSESLRDQSVRSAADELLRQGVVLVWSSFEVLCRDLLVSFLNAKPQEILTLTGAPSTKRHFSLRGIDLEILAEHGFDISSKIGTILAANYDLGSLGTLKAVFDVLFPTNGTAREALSPKGLWVLQQRRHLVVHQRSVVDQSYLSLTGEKCSPGEQLSITPDDLKNALLTVKESGRSLLEVVSDALVAG